MQQARDTFYVTLRDRLLAANPARTTVVRGVIRPGVLVEENELPTGEIVTEIFRLRWTALRIEAGGRLPLVTMECEIRYATDGAAGGGGADRGRALAAMDEELALALGTAPRSATKMNLLVSPPVRMGTAIFWAEPVFGSVVAEGERLSRTATATVWSYGEAGER